MFLNTLLSSTVIMPVFGKSNYSMVNLIKIFKLYLFHICLVGLFLTTTTCIGVTWTEGTKHITTLNKLKCANRFYNPPMHTDMNIAVLQTRYQPDQALNVPESSTISGIAMALVLNGLGLASSRYYLRRKHNRDSARGCAFRYTTHLPIHVDTMLSVVMILIVSPVLLTVAAVGALKTGLPKVYRCTKTPTTPINNEFVGTKTV